MKILPVFIPHLGCPFQCVYCDQNTITRSATNLDFALIADMISQFYTNNLQREKQVAFFGGTFTNLDRQLQRKLLSLVSLYRDESLSVRISTRPDCIDEEVVNFLQEHNVKTIELGVQSFDDNVLKQSKRGYTRERILQSCSLIKAKKLELGIQVMPGLPGFCRETWRKTIENVKQIQPELIRIYPTVVLKDTELERMYEDSIYSPLSLDEAVAYSAELLQEVPEISIAKLGLHSDIATEKIVAGPYHRAFGELVYAHILQKRIVREYCKKTLIISSGDISLFTGFGQKMLQQLKTKLKIKKIPVIIDKDMERHNFLFTEKPPERFL